MARPMARSWPRAAIRVFAPDRVFACCLMFSSVSKAAKSGWLFASQPHGEFRNRHRVARYVPAAPRVPGRVASTAWRTGAAHTTHRPGVIAWGV
jgi:hypothetical protein